MLSFWKGRKMKGIILAGGSGTRLYPLTKVMSKQLLPVYDKPMIYYPLATLMSFGIKDFLIISTPQDTPSIEKLLQDGRDLGIQIQYAVQKEPKGIAEAFTIGADFVGKEDVALILGDNIFYMDEQLESFRKKIDANKGKSATIFAHHVSDPERFGVVEFDKNNKAISIEEKPKKPKSNYASVGLYFYPADVVQKARFLKPSARGELEITDLNNLYLKEKRLNVVPMGRGIAWLDAGTFDSLLEAGHFVQILEQRQGLKMACLEEIALKNHFIGENQVKHLICKQKSGSYRTYLQQVLKGYHELH